MHYLVTALLVSFPFALTAPTSETFSTLPTTTSRLDIRNLPENFLSSSSSQLSARQPLPLPDGQHSCSRAIRTRLSWQGSRGSKRSTAITELDDTTYLPSTSPALPPRNFNPSPLCAMIAHFTFTNLKKTRALSTPIRVYPGLQYVFSIGCDVGVGSVVTWFKNRDTSDPLHDWSVLNEKDYRYSTTGTLDFEVSETTEVQFEVRFSFYGGSGEVGLFRVNVE